jgi:hypothetical protein
MKTIIAGSRTITNLGTIYKAVNGAGWFITEVVSGMAKGVDSLGERWARENGVLVRQFPANWDHYGRKAGPIRNSQMADYSDALIAVWDGKSRGTKHMIYDAKNKGLKTFVYRTL